MEEPTILEWLQVAKENGNKYDLTILSAEKLMKKVCISMKSTIIFRHFDNSGNTGRNAEGKNMNRKRIFGSQEALAKKVSKHTLLVCILIISVSCK